MFPLVLFDYHTIEVALSCECLFSMKGCSIYLEWFHFHSSLFLVYCLCLVHYGSVCPVFQLSIELNIAQCFNRKVNNYQFTVPF